MTQTPPIPKSPQNPRSVNEIDNRIRIAPSSPSPSPPVETQPRPRRQSALTRWLSNLPIRNKQIAALFTSEVISVVGLVGVGSFLIISGGRTQLLNQAKSELVVTDINYNIKINQMGFGFRGQSDNAAVIRAAKAAAQGQTLDPALRSQVKQILQNEIKARNIEYATLVGADRRIIVNANADRTGETFDPNNLVSQVFKNPEQIKTSEIVPWADLAKEAPPLPEGIQERDALVRYTVTPVKDPATGNVTGALVSGDIVNEKPSIVVNTLDAFDGGYSAVYQRQPDGKFILASALVQDDETSLEQAQPEIPLPDTSILEEAIEAGEVVTEREKIAGDSYTLAAESIKNFQGEPVAVLVRGTPESRLNNLLGNSLMLQLAIAAIALAADVILAILLGRVIAGPLERLRQNAKQFSQGDRHVRTDVVGSDEIAQLASTFNNMADSIEDNEAQLRQETAQTRLLADITSSRTTNQQEIDQTFVQALHNARKLLKVDRMVIYRFNVDQSGYISHESVARGLPVALNNEMGDPCIPQALIEDYRNGRVVPTSDVLQTDYHPDHMKLLERLQIRANLVVPVLCQGQLFGLLVAHHCTTTHNWSDGEITFMKRLAEQLGVTLDRVTTVQEREAEAKRSGVLRDIALKLAAALNSKEIFNTAVQEIRQAMSTDRVVVYQFDSSWKGTVIAESVESGWPQALGAEIADPCFADKYVEKYRQGRVQVTPDIYNAGLTECHLKQLEPFAVRANLVAPILVGGELLGLLIAHQCDQPRYWEQTEVDFFAQVATQVGLALDRANLLEQQRTAKETLQKRALELLQEVDPLSRGDLTIRASVTGDEIGTIADSYNSTIESLRKIVSQVQTAAEQVANTTNTSEASVQSLSTEAFRQTAEITAALDRIERMTASIRAVSANAQQAEATVRQASQTVQAGDDAMNRTVAGITVIRETVADTGEKVKRLGDSTQKISKVVSLIGSFAAQTHLLALKASIEAARAGEEGQGFAVIADEVRSLAAQSAEATAEIEKMVGQIQAETSEVVAAMEAGTEQVASGSKLVEETRASLTQITAASAQINQLVEAIAVAAVEQTQSSEAVAITMADVAAIAQNTSSSAASVSDSFKELLATAQDLQADVAQFKV